MNRQQNVENVVLQNQRVLNNVPVEFPNQQNLNDQGLQQSLQNARALANSLPMIKEILEQMTQTHKMMLEAEQKRLRERMTSEIDSGPINESPMTHSEVIPRFQRQ